MEEEILKEDMHRCYYAWFSLYSRNGDATSHHLETYEKELAQLLKEFLYSFRLWKKHIHKKT